MYKWKIYKYVYMFFLLYLYISIIIEPGRYPQREFSLLLNHVGTLNVNSLAYATMSVYSSCSLLNHVGILNVSSLPYATMPVYSSWGLFIIKPCQYTQREFWSNNRYTDNIFFLIYLSIDLFTYIYIYIYNCFSFVLLHLIVYSQTSVALGVLAGLVED